MFERVVWLRQRELVVESIEFAAIAFIGGEEENPGEVKDEVRDHVDEAVISIQI